MSSPAKAHEPTMEEILASIRRIISDDEPGAAKAPPKPTAEAKPVKPVEAPKPAAAEAEVSMADMGQDDIDAMFAAMDADPAPEPEPAPVDQAPPPPPPPPIDLKDALDVLEMSEEHEAEPEPAPPPPPFRARPPAPAPAPALREQIAAEADRLLSPRADESVQAAFGNLANTILAGSARTLDDIVREMLRPMLKAWLDDNLPPLVERLVRQEIERVARGGR